jgi:predicted Zn finger-like uncharacterized protein
MIIQCEQCQTKFKLDDSKVADKSIKVRCARCRHVFSVAGIQSVPANSAFFEQNAPVFQIDEDLEVTAEPALETAIDFESDTLHFTDDDSDFSYPSADSPATHDQVDTPKEPDDVDFGAFDFGEEGGDADKTAVAATASDSKNETVKQGRVTSPSKEEFGGLDFSGDDMFGDVVSTSPQEEAAESVSFDFGMDGFADSMGVESGAAGQNTSLASQDQTSENPFSLDDIDFGDELTSVAVQQVSTEELKPSQDLLFAPLATAQTMPVFDSGADTFGNTPAQSVQEELPPLSITSRRKESPRVSGMLVFMGIIIAGLVVFYSYWGYVTLTEDKGTMTMTPQETGRITVRSVEASFIKNKNTGDLLVISGEAVNEYNKPRAAIQIKGIVFGADGEEVSSKSAFCGNPLSEEQLTTMTMDKIEATMTNQFGDSLANMEVAPGNAIPFVIVLPRPPAGATDYGVEPVGSTVATVKEK